MLRDMRLAQAQYGFHVTNTLLSISQYIQDRQTRGVHQSLEELSLGLIGFHLFSRKSYSI
jgi:hypothetical protein